MISTIASAAAKPGSHLVFTAFVGFITTVDENTTWLAAELAIFIQVLEKIRRHCLSRLYLDGNRMWTRLQDKIHLVAASISPEIQRWPLPVMLEHFEQFGIDKVFEDGTTQGVRS